MTEKKTRRLAFKSPATDALKGLEAACGFMSRDEFYGSFTCSPHSRSNAVARMQAAGYIEVTVELTKEGERALADLRRREGKRNA